jgi:DNA-binding transcriptional LysR family regulator
VNNSDAYTAACLAGFGLIQAPRYGAARHLESGELVEVLPDHPSEPMPVSLVHGHGRNVPRTVRAIMSWITQLMEPHLD